MSSKVWGHFKTITKHKLMVMSYCFRIGLYKQGLMHDMSKYSPSEFIVGCKYYQGFRSPNNAEREAIGASTAWMHHKGRNKHHYEYWMDYGLSPCETVIAPVEMPRKYVAEMIMDRIAASKVYAGDGYSEEFPLKYYNRSKEKMWIIHQKTKEHMELLLTMLAENGEKETFSYIKNVFLKEK